MPYEVIVHRCGHAQGHELKGSIRQQAVRSARLSNRDCPACSRQARTQDRAKKSAQARAENQARGLPALVGSARQVASAEIHRARGLLALRKAAAYWGSDALIEARVDLALRGSALSADLREALVQVTEARVWIEARAAFLEVARTHQAGCPESLAHPALLALAKRLQEARVDVRKK